MKVWAKTDIGKAREMNQDNFYIAKENEDIKLYVLADGMGGYKGGEIASVLAIRSAINYIENNFVNINKENKSIVELIKDAIMYSNMVVTEKAKESEEFSNMGTTIEICLIYDKKAYIGHIGDSRVYLIRGKEMTKLTKDHSYVETLVDDGTITREEAKIHPKKNMLIKALGAGAFVEPDIFDIELLENDIIIITSDGLTNMVSEKEILFIINNNIETAVEKLIEEANKNGGYDNITAIIIYNN